MSESASFHSVRKVLAGGGRSPSRRSGIGASRVLCLQRVRTSNTQPRERTCPAVSNHTAMIHDPLELSGRRAMVTGRQISISSYIRRVKAIRNQQELGIPILDLREGTQRGDGLGWVISSQCDLSSKWRAATSIGPVRRAGSADYARYAAATR